jgi:hypothetical protein
MELSFKEFKQSKLACLLQKTYIHQKLKIIKNPKRMEYVNARLNEFKIEHLPRYNLP